MLHGGTLLETTSGALTYSVYMSCSSVTDFEAGTGIKVTKP